MFLESISFQQRLLYFIFCSWSMTKSQDMTFSCGIGPMIMCVMMFFTFHFALNAYSPRKGYCGHLFARITKMHKIPWWNFSWGPKTLEGHAHKSRFNGWKKIHIMNIINFDPHKPIHLHRYKVFKLLLQC